MFDRMANGKSEIVVAEVTNPWMKSRLEETLKSQGITNGKITKEQYLKSVSQFMGGRGPQGAAPAPVGATPASPSPAGAAGAWDAQAEADFKRRDANGDGFLTENEMNRSLLAVWRDWDANKDGRIDLKEYKAYFKAQMEARQARTGGGGFIPTVQPPVEEEEKKPTVYRAGKLPKGIPDWFEKLDTDNDGQIGLYEWVKAGRTVEDFEAIDRNRDGFLTIQEVMRAEKNKPKGKKGAKLVASMGLANLRGR